MAAKVRVTALLVLLSVLAACTGTSGSDNAVVDTPANSDDAQSLTDPATNPTENEDPSIPQTEIPPTPADPPTVVDPLELGEFTLRLDSQRFELIEANENGVTVPIHISRIDGHQRPVVVTVEPAAGTNILGIQTELQNSVLASEEIYTSWRAQLGVTMAPLLFHDREFVVTADDGRKQESLNVILSVRPIAAPDIYLLIGQSNMEGNSQLGTRDTSEGGLDARHPRILQLNVKQNNRGLFSSDEQFTDESFNVMDPRYILAEDPLHEPRFPYRDDKEGSFIGLGLSFAKAALPYTTQEIILVPAAWSARGFCANDDASLAWNADNLHGESALGGSLLTERALTRLNMVLRDKGGVFRGILWHQGEADANNPICADRYEANVVKLAQRLRRDAFIDARGVDARKDDAAIPFILGTMSRGNNDQGNFSVFSETKQRVDNAHRNLMNVLPFSELANADDLIPPSYPCGQSSCIHFGAKALRTLGRRYYEGLGRIINNRN